MTKQRLSVEVKDDFIERQSKAPPVNAVSELIWNCLDGDATEVSVELVGSDLANEPSKIIIEDNGLGFSHPDASKYFSLLGGSWKRQNSKTTIRQRNIHGSEGRGRYKALALGKNAVWKVCYESVDKKRHCYDIEMSASDFKSFTISDPVSTDAALGVKVTIEQLHEKSTSVTSFSAVQKLAEIFAPYLMSYKDINVEVDGDRLDASSIVETEQSFQITPVTDRKGQDHLIELQVIEWKNSTPNMIYFCSADGFPLHQMEHKSRTTDYSFSAYLKSSYVSILADSGRLTVPEMDENLNKAISESDEIIRNHFRGKAAHKVRSIVEKWKEEKIYPFRSDDDSPIAQVERQVFDIVAANVQNYPSEFEKAPKKTRELQLHLLRTAIESSPNDLQKIISEVVQMSKEKQKVLAELLEENTLAAIIKAAKTVANRIKFIDGLEQIVFDTNSKKNLKERSQLHRILVDNTWIFGEKYNLWVSDRDLTRVLEKYKKHLDPNIQIDEPVTLVDNKKGVLDLMLSQQIQLQHKDVTENLVIELKAPRVKLNADSIVQIKKYAQAVASDERFHTLKDVKWDFWLISNDYDDYVSADIAGGPDPSKRLIQDNRQMNLTIGIKSWSEIITENRDRLNFFRENLEYKADKCTATQFLRERYAEFLHNVIES